MKILLVRHGQAVSAHRAGDDRSRWLTESGRAAARRVAERAHAAGFAPSVLYTSPLVRAVQTAELFAQALGEPPVLVHGPLAGGSSAEILAALDAHADGDHVALVGHEPTMTSLASFLGRDRRFPGFTPATAFLAEGDPAAGTTRFVWLIDPADGRLIRDLRAFSPF